MQRARRRCMQRARDEERGVRRGGVSAARRTAVGACVAGALANLAKIWRDLCLMCGVEKHFDATQEVLRR